MDTLDDDWELSAQTAHPNAASLLKEPFYWDVCDESSPFGNDSGADTLEFYRAAIDSNADLDGSEFLAELFVQMERLKVSRELAQRYLNDGFSGGEKKRVEILQMAMLKPRLAVLDETDSGLDIDALKIVAGGVKQLVGPTMGALVITHYQRILDYITPDFVHVFVDGKIVEQGGPELAKALEKSGYVQWEQVAV